MEPGTALVGSRACCTESALPLAAKFFFPPWRKQGASLVYSMTAFGCHANGNMVLPFPTGLVRLSSMFRLYRCTLCTLPLFPPPVVSFMLTAVQMYYALNAHSPTLPLSHARLGVQRPRFVIGHDVKLFKGTTTRSPYPLCAVHMARLRSRLPNSGVV